MKRLEKLENLIEALGEEELLKAITRYMSEADFEELNQFISTNYNLDYEGE